ncbi:MAG: phosphatidylglycerophosphatase and protein-tyrosine phosphatase 1 family protein [Planctomycetota bacterium]
MLDRVYAGAVFYPTWAWNLLLGRVLKIRPWWDFIDDQVILGARPLNRDVVTLRELGVRAVVNTCEEYVGPLELYGANKIEQLYIPTTDFTHPKLEDVIKAVAFVQAHAERGNVTYIHCKAGRARSATIAMCWLMAHRGMSADEAQQHLLSRRPHVNTKLTERPVVNEFRSQCEQES